MRGSSQQLHSEPSHIELLERSELLDALVRALIDAAKGRGRLVLLGGEAGVGKTALLRAFCRDHVSSTARVLWGASERLFTPRALGPFLDIAQAAGIELGGYAPHSRVPHEFLAALVGELPRSALSVLVVEDVHWADDGTLDMLKLLARRIGELPALALVSFRDDELSPVSPLQMVLGELARVPTVKRHHVPPLSLDAVRILAAPCGADAGRLFEMTGGNPFFVTEALAAADVELPDTVRGAVLGRAAQLSPSARTLLEAAAVVPSRIEWWLLEAIADLSALEECLSSGMLRAGNGVLEFRHELARLAIEGAIAPHRRVALHLAVLGALGSSARGSVDPARLSHHADAAGDVDAVLRHAPEAGERAAELCAHHEAAEQFARALRHAVMLPPERRAYLCERRSYECYLTQQIAEAIEARREALVLHHASGDRVREGDSHRWLSRLVWFAGDRATAVLEARLAVELLEAEPPGRELAMAYSNQAQLCMLAEDAAGAIEAGSKAIALGERLGETEILVHALNNVGTAEAARFRPSGVAKLERSLALALEAGLEEHVARAYTNLSSRAFSAREHAAAERHLSAGLAYCEEHDLDAWASYMIGWLACLSLERGRWDEAANHAIAVLRRGNVAIPSRIQPLVVLGRLRARRGDPQPWGPLNEALELARRTEELQRLAPVAAARAEARWLAGDLAAVGPETEDALALALQIEDQWAIGELCAWRRRAGIEDRVEIGALPAPYRLERQGEWKAAARRWEDIGCPYEAAMVHLQSEDEDSLQKALTVFHGLQAVPAARAAAQRLRSRGVRRVARGPNRSTITNPLQLTSRQLETLELLSEGLTNSEIAARLYITPKTAEHHVSAILAKLGVRSRKQAPAEAIRLGVPLPRRPGPDRPQN
jgi:DNA-binding CsgD family transcriptional regulator